MGHRFVRYCVDGEPRWAIWSTVTDSFILYDATAEEVVEHEAQRAYERRKEQAEDRIRAIKDGEDPYPGNTLMSDDDIKKLKGQSHG